MDLLKSPVKLVPSKEMQAYVRANFILDVALIQPHRYLAGTAHELYCDSKGRDCNNSWMGTASMSSEAHAIYNALCQLVIDPEKFVSETFMLSIFEK